MDVTYFSTNVITVGGMRRIGAGSTILVIAVSFSACVQTTNPCTTNHFQKNILTKTSCILDTFKWTFFAAALDVATTFSVLSNISIPSKSSLYRISTTLHVLAIAVEGWKIVCLKICSGEQALIKDKFYFLNKCPRY